MANNDTYSIDAKETVVTVASWGTYVGALLLTKDPEKAETVKDAVESFGGVVSAEQKNSISGRVSELCKSAWDIVLKNHNAVALRSELRDYNFAEDPFHWDSFNVVCERVISACKVKKMSLVKTPYKKISVDVMQMLANMMDNDLDLNNTIRLSEISKMVETLLINQGNKEPEKTAIHEITNGGQPLTDIPLPVSLLGRDQVIGEIKERLKENSTICITAAGGIGKSAVAATICNDYKYKSGREDSVFKYIAWITSTGDLRRDLCQIDLPKGIHTTDEDERFNNLYQWLKTSDNSLLLVIDNMDTPPTREEKTILNTISGKTKVIITSRASFDAINMFDLHEIDDQAAIRLLYRHYLGFDEPIDSLRDRDDYSIVESLVAGLSNNALLIELIGKMAYSEDKELSEIWEMLNENVIGIESELAIETAHAESHGLNPITDENLTLKEQVRRLYQISELSESQRDIMSFMVLFPIGTKVYHKIPYWYGCNQKDIQWLLRRGWIKKEGNSYSIHPIVKSSVELQNMESGYSFELTRLFNLIAELIKTEQYLPKSMEYIEYRKRAEVPKAICYLVEHMGIIGRLPFSLCICVAGLFYREGNYNESIRYSFKALDILKMLYGEEDENAAAIYDSVGMVYFELHQFGEALKLLNKGIEIKSKIFEEDHLNMAISYNNLAEVYDRLGDYEKSERYFYKALDILVNQLGEYNLYTINTYDNLGNMYCDWGKYEKALKYHIKALEFYETECGEKDPETATAYNNIGSTYYKMGDNLKAKYYLEKTIAIRREILDAKHPHIMITLIILRDVYDALGDIDSLIEVQRVLKEEFNMDDNMSNGNRCLCCGQPKL